MKDILKIFFLITIQFVCFNIYAQIESMGSPIHYGLKSMSGIPVVEIEYAKIAALNSAKDNFDESLKIIKIAKQLKIDINTHSNGRWIKYNDFNVWQISIKAEQAKFIGLICSKFKLPEGAKMFIYNDNSIRGAFTKLNNKIYGSLIIAPLPGDLINIELQVPEYIEFDPELEINAITYGIKDIFTEQSKNSLKSGYCNIDVNCNTDYQIQLIKYSVVKILANGEDLCSGTLLNNSFRNGKYYVLTANHCISSYAAANNSIFYFNYESPYCEGPPGSDDNTISGSNLIATKQSLDFTLVELSIDPPYHYHPYLSGWSIDTANIQSTFSVHHPLGDVKKIAIDNDSPVIESYDGSFDQNAFFRIKKWDLGTTEGGSSGGPLFNNNYHLIGSLTGGSADCADPIDDYFAMLARAWDDFPDSTNQLKYWLDPMKSEISGLEALDPFEEIKLHNLFIDNIENNDVLTLERAGDWGYISGHSSLDYNVFAEKFNTTDSVSLIAFLINVAKADKIYNFAKVRFQVWNNNLEDNSIIYYKDFKIDYFRENYNTLIELDDFYPVYGDFYIGYRIFYYSEQDTFALFHTSPKAPTEENTAFAYRFDVGWVPLYEIIGESSPVSLDIKPFINNPDYIIGIKPSNYNNKNILIFPNPASSILNVKFNDLTTDMFAIFDINGRQLLLEKIDKKCDQMAIDINKFQNGIYLIKIWSQNESNFYKFIVRH